MRNEGVNEGKSICVDEISVSDAVDVIEKAGDPIYEGRGAIGYKCPDSNGVVLSLVTGEFVRVNFGC